MNSKGLTILLIIANFLTLSDRWLRPDVAQAIGTNTQYAVMYGFGTPAACTTFGSGWTEETGDTGSGSTITPVTAITTTSIAPVTSIGVTRVGFATPDTTWPAAGSISYLSNNVATSGSATSYTVANGGTTTSTQIHFRVCRKG